ncbi:MAG: fimbrillin family protein [Muribaculaceae bacterium]|nr:fimbrillin family protein [Muribaculaceae bacterium]
MRKSLIYLAVGALALTACTSEDVVNNVGTSSRNAIKFNNVVNKHSRGTDITTDGLNQFQVFGFYTMPGNAQHAHQVFDNTTVKKVGTIWDYASEGIGERYWIPGAHYYFYAYSCDNKAISDAIVSDIKYVLDMDGEKDASSRVLEIQDYVCDDTHQHDLIFASNADGIVGKETGNQDVALEFSHILSKVRASFTTKFPSEYEIEISDITIQDIRNKGNYDPINKWHAVAGKTNLTILGDDNSIMVKNALDGEKQMSTTTDQFYVIPNGKDDPAEGVTVALKFTIDVYIGQDRTEKVMSKTLVGEFTPNWQDGYQYVYNVDINGNTTNMQVISFTTSVNEFGTPETSEEIKEFEVTNNAI